MTLPSFAWMRPVVANHIHHPFQVQMSQQSHVFQLPIQMKNEAKHEDCVDILDGYEDILQVLFTKAFGEFSNGNLNVKVTVYDVLFTSSYLLQ